ncbi:MAG TPA: glycoside hydrolase family 2 protein [Puia sp.]|nr:glycoside hydrolase family 2 protein [Puia sp.]
MAQHIDLSNLHWKFRKGSDTAWLPASVPGTVHTDLLANGKITDPFYRNNEKSLQWIERSDWEYMTEFRIDRSILAKDRVDLKFDGLDTYADVFLNGEKIVQANNMFRSWKLPVKEKLKTGLNQLRIYFHSPINKALLVYDSLSYTIPVSNNDQAEKRVSVFARKAGYHYGWDWGPRFVTSGIWRPVTLIAWDQLDLEDVFIRQRSLTREKAVLEADMEATSLTDGIRSVEIWIRDEQRLLAKKDVRVYKGKNNLNISFDLEQPELWWPNGMGKQKLYKFTILLKDAAGKLLAESTVRQGLRQVELVQESDDQGRSFYFKVNGRPVFMKGANYIPQDNFLPSVTRERYQQIINSAATAHMNMLRVWGGGIYQNDLFYDLCDEKGILVWQDFMFACSLWPPFEDLKQNIYQEAVDNIKRLRSHPSIALWCGNNEVVSFFNSDFWGQVQHTWKTEKDSTALFDTYKDIFHYILPAAVKAFDDERPYWSTSPAADNFSMAFTPERMTGDMHYWGVWGGKDKIEEYNKNVPRFMSEYGFQSFPEMPTIRKFADSTDLNINSAVMASHQRSNRGNAGILEYMKDWFKMPAAFDRFIYVGQLLQSEAIRVAIEAHRRAKPYCMGSLFWQIDDCWPAASWSSIDYYGRWKALQYQARRSFATLLISTIATNDSIDIHLVSDSVKDMEGHLEIRLMDFKGRVIKRLDRPVTLRADESRLVYGFNKTEWLGGSDPKTTVLETIFSSGQQQLAQNLYYFEKPKDLELPPPALKYDITQQDDKFTITVHAGALARFVNISVGEENIIFSDNYFDLLPGQPRRITFQSALPPERIKQDIRIISLKDSLDN